MMEKMKKSLIVLFLLASVLSSCSYYTCATYASKKQRPAAEENM